MSRYECSKCNTPLAGRPQHDHEWKMPCPNCRDFVYPNARAVHIEESSRLSPSNLALMVEIHDRVLRANIAKTDDEAKMAAVYCLERRRMAGGAWKNTDFWVERIRRGHAWKTKHQYVAAYDTFIEFSKKE